jgi:lipid-binding SYLF domain-containing protein
MSAPEKNPAANEPYYPPPPPGPPPVQGHGAHQPSYAAPPQQSQATHGTAQPSYAAPPQQSHAAYGVTQPTFAAPPQHPDETPIPDSNIPTYYPSMQQLHDEYSAAELYDNDIPNENTTKPSWSQRFAGLGAKAAAPFNAVANKLGAEAFLPTTMDKECEKAARILRSFCKDGIYSESTPQTAPSQTTGPPAATSASTTTPGAPHTTKADDKAKSKPKVLLTIPSKVIARAQGLAIFTTVRAGFHVSGASGSGVLIARLPDGSWSPPSGIQVHSLGAGLVVGLDIYDCVVVINTREALEAFTKTRMSLGSDLAVAAGPWGAGGSVDWGMDRKDKVRESRDKMGDEKPAVSSSGATGQTHPQVTTGTGTASTAPLSTPATGTSKDRKPSPFREALKKPVYSYVKSRGFYAGVQIDGTVVTERKDANAAFYGDKTITVGRILAGNVHQQSGPHVWPAASKGLLEVLAGAEGWRGQQGKGHGPSLSGGAGAHSNAGTGVGTGLSGVTESVQGMDLNANPVPPGGPLNSHPPTQSYDQSSKAAEAEAERRANEPLGAGPPSYYEPGPSHLDGHGAAHHDAGHQGEMPPAYVDDGVPRPGVGDSKTGQH